MPATNKMQLEAVTAKEFEKLEALIKDIDPQSALVKDADDTSIKDIIAHRAHWIALFLGWYADGIAGKEVHFPAKGYKWNELKAYNRQLREDQFGLGWQQAVENLENNHAQLTAFLDSKTDEELYSAPMKGANNHWTPGRWAEAAGPSHYRSATKYIKTRLKSLT